MPIENAILTWIHLVSAAIWVGGGIFLGVVLSPILKRLEMTIQERISLMIKIARRFNKIAIPALLILIGTGIYNAHPFLSQPSLLLETSYGLYLVIKIILVISVIITYIIHVRIINKDVEEKIISKQLSEIQIQKLRKKIIILGEITTVLSIGILFFAALLDSGI